MESIFAPVTFSTQDVIWLTSPVIGSGAFQSITVPSESPLAIIRPSGAKASALMAAGCCRRGPIGLEVATSQSRDDPPRSPIRTIELSGLNKAVRIESAAGKTGPTGCPFAALQS